MLKPTEYFARYAEHLGTGCGSVKAFDRTEREFFKEYGVRRFKNHESFRRSYWLFRQGRHNRLIVCHIVEDFDFKK